MTTIAAEVIADSICNGHRITTMKVTFPRFILAEFNTHRMLSKNSASSRAIPFNKMLDMVTTDPFIPIAWQKDHKGMQGTEYLSKEDRNDPDPTSIIRWNSEHESANKAWLAARDEAVKHALILNSIGATKQLCNRLLEPFMWHTVLVTATEWENFFHLRCPQYPVEAIPRDLYRSKKDLIASLKDFPQIQEAVQKRSELDWLRSNEGQAEIHMMALAEAMWDARNESKPKELKPGEWHIPFGDNMNEEGLHNLTSYKADYGGVHSSEITDYLKEQTDLKVKVAVARAARTSYTVVGANLVTGDGAHVAAELYRKDIELHNRLLASGHMSPFEHCAQAMTKEEIAGYVRGQVKTFVEADGDIGIHEKYVYIDRAESNLMDMHGWCHNLRGWKSYRSMIPNENRR